VFNFPCPFITYIICFKYLRRKWCVLTSLYARETVYSSFSFSWKYRTLSLQICVCQTVLSIIEYVDWCRNVCTLYKHLCVTPAAEPLWPATWSSASLSHGQAYHKTSSRKQLFNGKSDYVQAWRQMTSLWTSAKLKPAFFRANTLDNRLFSEPPTVYRGKHVVSRNFNRSYLKANEVSKSEGTRKVKYAYHFWRCADDGDRKLLKKFGHACRSDSLPKLARFLRHSVNMCHHYLPEILQSLINS